MTIALYTKNLVKDYENGDEKTRILHGVNLELEAGKLTMMVGPSGCGKTTLLSIISGILSPTEGCVYIGETNLCDLRGDKKVLFRRNNLGFIFQEFNLLPTLSAAENAAIPLIAAGMSFKEALDKARTILSDVGLKNHTEKKPKHLSGGQMQRVAFARALVHGPKVVVCDEPTSALDEETGQQVMQVLKKVAVQPDSAVIVVTHDARIYKYADHIIHMNDGKILKEEKKGTKNES